MLMLLASEDGRGALAAEHLGRGGADGDVAPSGIEALLRVADAQALLDLAQVADALLVARLGAGEAGHQRHKRAEKADDGDHDE